MPAVGIVGCTSWGTTLGIVLARRGVPVVLWARTAAEAATLQGDGENRRLLPGFPFPPGLSVSQDPEEALGGAEAVVVAVPSRSLRENLRRVRASLPRGAMVVSAVKGLERESGLRMSQVMAEELGGGRGGGVAVLSGPNLSREIAEGKPSSAVAACRDQGAARAVQGLLNTREFRVYTSDDVAGVELGGALKNVIAIGAGVSDGLGFGANAKAAFVTRGLAEITRLGVAAGAQPLTMAGLSGLGDLVATCFSPLSRNRFVGEQIGMGRRLPEVLAGMSHVAEGIDTTPAALALAARHGVEMPIAEAVSRVLFEGLEPEAATATLLNRAPGREWPQGLARTGHGDA